MDDDRVLVKLESEPDVDDVASDARPKFQRGVIVDVGPGEWDDAVKMSHLSVDLRRGDLVIFGRCAGMEVELGGKRHLLLRADEVLAVALTLDVLD